MIPLLDLSLRFNIFSPFFYIKDNNSIAVSSGNGKNRCITIIDIESQEVMTTISMDINIYGMAVRGRGKNFCCASEKGLKKLKLDNHDIV
jgi:hypothetical protein